MASRKAHDGGEGRRIETLRVSVVRERSPLSYALAAPIDAARTARELVGDDLDREVFGILLVNTRNRITAMHIVSVGTLNGACAQRSSGLRKRNDRTKCLPAG